jgi:eukaryotic-like serine/threonine-protein kinase
MIVALTVVIVPRVWYASNAALPMSGRPTSNSPRPHVFGPFAFDEVSGELSKHGIRMRLQGQPLQILATLVRRPGQLISRGEFQQQLWSSSTFVDFEHGLNAAMNRLRQVLGDSADQPRYIETVPGRGYRFIAALQNPDAGPVLVLHQGGAFEGQSGLPTAPATARHSRAKWLPWVIAAGVLASLAIGYLAAVRILAHSEKPTLRFGISAPDGYAMEPGSSRQTFELSPDGTRLAFSAMNASGVFQAFVRDLASLDARPVPNSFGSYHVFWAPDGQSLFLTVRGSLRRYPLGGDSYQVICEAPAIMLTGAVMGSNLLISARAANFVVPMSGGTPKQTELYPWPQVLPDGKHIVYVAFDARAGHHRAHVVEPGKPETDRELVETDSRVIYTPSLAQPGTGYLLYVRAGNLLAHPFDPKSLRIEGEPLPVVSRIYSFFPTGAADFSVSNNGMLAYRRYVSRSQLAWFNRHGDLVKRIGPDSVNIEDGRLSPDGKKIAAPIYNVERGVTEIWIIDRETGTSRKSISGPGLVASPTWAPDSQKLAYQGAYEGPPKLFFRGIGESEPEQKLPEGLFQVPTDWSRNGRYIAYTSATFSQSENEMRGDVWVIDMDRGHKVVPLISTPFHEANPTFSPDGRWLAFTSNESGRTEVYIQAFVEGESPHMAGERHVVSSQGAVSLRWRRDGRELFYLAQDGRIYGVPISWFPKLTLGEPVPLFSVNTEARAAIHSVEGFDVSEDGQNFLVPMITSKDKSEIVVIQNWEAEAQRNQGKHD